MQRGIDDPKKGIRDHFASGLLSVYMSVMDYFYKLRQKFLDSSSSVETDPRVVCRPGLGRVGAARVELHDLVHPHQRLEGVDVLPQVVPEPRRKRDLPSTLPGFTPEREDPTPPEPPTHPQPSSRYPCEITPSHRKPCR